MTTLLCISTDGTTHSENATSIEDLDPDTRRDLRRQLNRNFKRIIEKYASFAESLCDAVTDTGVTVKKFRNYILNLSPYGGDYICGDEKPILLDHVKAEIKMADSIIDIFQVLTTECCSFMNVDILQSIMTKYKIDPNSDDLRYIDHLKCYLVNHKISEFIMINPKLDRFKNSDTRILKFNTELSSSITKVLDLKSAIANIFGLKSAAALQLLSIKEGCVVVTFSILSSVAESVFARGLTAKQEADIRALSVLWLESGDYKLEEIPHNADNKDHIGMIRYQSCAALILFLSTAVAPELLVPKPTHGSIADVQHPLDSGMKLQEISVSL